MPLLALYWEGMGGAEQETVVLGSEGLNNFRGHWTIGAVPSCLLPGHGVIWEEVEYCHSVCFIKEMVRSMGSGVVGLCKKWEPLLSLRISFLWKGTSL